MHFVTKKGYIFSDWKKLPKKCSKNHKLEYPWLFTVLRTQRKMARHFAKVSEEEIKTAFFYPSDLVNTKITIPLRVGEERLGIYPPNSQPRIMHFAYSDWFPQSWLSAHIP